jgi:hypothetical protein
LNENTDGWSLVRLWQATVWLTMTVGKQLERREMKATSELARAAHKSQYDWALRYGESQVDHFFRGLTEDFDKNTMIAVSAAILDDVQAKWAACVETGAVDLDGDQSVSISTVSLSKGKALSVRYDDGDNLLFAWEADEDEINFAIIPWKDPVPAALIAELNQAAAGDGVTFADLVPIARKFSRYSELYPEARDVIYESLPLSMSDIKKALEKEGIERLGWVVGLGSVRIRSGMPGLTDHESTAGRKHSLVESVERIASTFSFAQNVKLNRAVPHYSALKAGQYEEFYASTSAYAFERHLEKELSKINEIVSISEDIGLSSEIVYAYNDTDVSVYGQRFEGRDLFYHFNLDMGSHAFATIMNKKGDEVASIDVILASNWGFDFENYFGSTMEDVVRPDLAMEFMRYVVRDNGIIPEETLVSVLAEGRVPEAGRAMSYDMTTKTLELTKLAYEAGYLDYLPGMATWDLEALKEGVSGDYSRLVEFKDRLNDKGIEPEEYFASRKAPSI